MTVKHDRLLAAVIARLPVATTPWDRDDRVAWLRMMALACDVVYGPCGGVHIAAIEEAAATREAAATKEAAAPAAPADPRTTMPATPRRFYVDRDGFAMGDGRPIAMEDLPAGATLWDERGGIECGDAAAILWRDVGATHKSLPPGVILKPATDAA
jgi:hypothetical protein